MFQHLNHANRWPHARRLGIEVDPTTGTLSLRRLPGPPRLLAELAHVLPPYTAAAGTAVGHDGTIYFSDPTTNRVFAMEPLAQRVHVLDCLGATTLQKPQGLAFQACRQRLLIADTDQHRIVVVDPAQERVVDVWGQVWPDDPPQPCGSRGGLDYPEQLSCDRRGNVYVVDRLAEPKADEPEHVVRKLNRDGQRLYVDFTCDEGFDPAHIAVGEYAGKEIVFVLATSGTQLSLFLFNPHGARVYPGPLPLLTADESTPPTRQFAGFGFEEVREAHVTAFTVLDSFAIVSLAPKPVTSSAAVAASAKIVPAPFVTPTAGTGRVWCFEFGEVLRHERDVAEPSALPHFDGGATAFAVRAGTKPDLLVHTGQAVYALPHNGAYRTQGAFLAGPITGQQGQPTYWQRLRLEGTMPPHGRIMWFTLSRAEVDGITAQGIVGPVRLARERLPSWFRPETQPDLFAFLGFSGRTEEPLPDEPNAMKPPLLVDHATNPRQSEPTPASYWYAAPEQQFDGLVRNTAGTVHEPADELWVFGVLASDGLASPRLMQARVDYNDDGWLNDLPDVYQRNPRRRAFLRALTGLMASRLEDVAQAITQLPSLFVPDAMLARYGVQSAELDWLRSVLALPAIPRWGTADDTARHRQLLRDGPYWLARRDTPEGLRRLLYLTTGVEVFIDEPGLLENPNIVCFPTGTSPSDPVNACCDVGSETSLGYSVLPDPNDRRPRVTNDLTHHFVVRGYEPCMAQPDARAALERMVERFAPAHTTYSVQVIEPRARVEVQARLGIDAVVAQDADADPLTLNSPPGPEAQLDPTPRPPTLGDAHADAYTPLR